MKAIKTLTIIDWVVRVLLGVLFIAAATMKLSGQPMMVQEFNVVGLGQGFRYLTGLMELSGAVLIFMPRLALFGAVILSLVDAGAFVAQLTRLHGDVIHTIVIGLLLTFVFYVRGKVKPV